VISGASLSKSRSAKGECYGCSLGEAFRGGAPHARTAGEVKGGKGGHRDEVNQDSMGGERMTNRRGEKEVQIKSW